jgi:putative addiction module antidote
MLKLKLRAVGTSTGLTLRKESLRRMKVERGDTLFGVQTLDGYLLTPLGPEVEQQVKLGLEFMVKYRHTFRALAK